jgi:hypothetical protein
MRSYDKQTPFDHLLHNQRIADDEAQRLRRAWHVLAKHLADVEVRHLTGAARFRIVSASSVGLGIADLIF